VQHAFSVDVVLDQKSDYNVKQMSDYLAVNEKVKKPAKRVLGKKHDQHSGLVDWLSTEVAQWSYQDLVNLVENIIWSHYINYKF